MLNRKFTQTILNPIKLLSVIDYFAASEKVPLGGIVQCTLAGVAEHSGIYIGNKEIVHLNGDGLVEKVSPSEFVGRLDGSNPAFRLYCATKESFFGELGEPIGDKVIAERAIKMIGTRRNYDLLINNCHTFTSECVSGKNEAITTFAGLCALLVRQYPSDIGKLGWSTSDLY